MMLRIAAATVGADLSEIAFTLAILVKALVLTKTNLFPLELVFSGPYKSIGRAGLALLVLEEALECRAAVW